jgi:hypothetical protein
MIVFHSNDYDDEEKDYNITVTTPKTLLSLNNLG